MLSRRMLSKEEEGEGGPDAEVTKDDQDKINSFSRLHNRERIIEEQLQTKQKDKEDVEEISTELELADEDELVPYIQPSSRADSRFHESTDTSPDYSYRIGDSFMSLPLPEAQAMLSTSSEQIDEEVSKLEESLQELRDEMKGLKAQLYARFGKSINLD